MDPFLGPLSVERAFCHFDYYLYVLLRNCFVLFGASIRRWIGYTYIAEVRSYMPEFGEPFERMAYIDTAEVAVATTTTPMAPNQPMCAIKGQKRIESRKMVFLFANMWFFDIIIYHLTWVSIRSRYSMYRCVVSHLLSRIRPNHATSLVVKFAPTKSTRRKGKISKWKKKERKSTEHAIIDGRASGTWKNDFPSSCSISYVAVGFLRFQRVAWSPQTRCGRRF